MKQTTSWFAFRVQEQIARWTRERFDLPASAVVLVDQLASSQPGFPPHFTLIVFWSEPMVRRHQLKVFKPMALVTPDDLPPYWMKVALTVPPGSGCETC